MYHFVEDSGTANTVASAVSGLSDKVFPSKSVL